METRFLHQKVLKQLQMSSEIKVTVVMKLNIRQFTKYTIHELIALKNTIIIHSITFAGFQK